MSVTARKSEAKVKNVPMTKELITTWVKRDIETLYSLAYEMLSTPGVIEILSEKLYQRAKAEQQKAEQEQSESIPVDENV